MSQKPIQEPSHIGKMAIIATEDSLRWFGDQPAAMSIPHLVLALCGEVGEVANIVKKIERGTLNINDATTRYDLNMEIADVFTYLLAITGAMNIDLEAAYQMKRTYNEQRFTVARKIREAGGDPENGIPAPRRYNSVPLREK